MPSKSKAQHNFMEAIAHSEKFAQKAGVSQKVGKDFTAADKSISVKKLPKKVAKKKRSK